MVITLLCFRVKFNLNNIFLKRYIFRVFDEMHVYDSPTHTGKNDHTDTLDFHSFDRDCIPQLVFDATI